MDWEICPNGLTIFPKALTLNSILTWNPLFCGNGKTQGSDQLHIKHKKYVQRGTFQNNSNQEFATWNGYPKNIVNGIIKRAL